jgi:hypothetical protein
MAFLPIADDRCADGFGAAGLAGILVLPVAAFRTGCLPVVFLAGALVAAFLAGALALTGFRAATFFLDGPFTAGLREGAFLAATFFTAPFFFTMGFFGAAFFFTAAFFSTTFLFATGFFGAAFFPVADRLGATPFFTAAFRDAFFPADAALRAGFTAFAGLEEAALRLPADLAATGFARWAAFFPVRVFCFAMGIGMR